MITDTDINDYKELMNDKDTQDDLKLFTAFAMTGLISGMSTTRIGENGETISNYPEPTEIAALAKRYGEAMIAAL